MKAAATPVMRQYHTAKASQADAILFFRMGDFYEMFYDDAVLAARELELTLTSRNKGATDEVPMAGVPHHAAHGYIAKLVAKGYKVALCEQMADPSKTRGIVPREVVRVITPALVTATEHLDARSNHFLAAVEPGAAGAGFGLALLDLSTGELRAAILPSLVELLGELAKAAPREVLLGALADDPRQSLQTVLPGVVLRTDDELTPAQATTQLVDTLGEEEARATLARVDPRAQMATARAVRFAARCSPGARLPISHVTLWNPQDTLALDETAQRHLELVASIDGQRQGSLLHLLDTTCTPAGARLLRRWILAPLVDVAAIRCRHDVVDLFVTHAGARGRLREALADIADIERLAVRASLREATPRDLGSLRDTLAAVPRVAAALDELSDPTAPDILGLTADPLDTLADLGVILTTALVERPPPLARDAGIFREGYNAELDELRGVQKHSTALLTELEGKLRVSTGANTLKIKYTRVFGWYIEVTGKYLDRVPTTWRRKQTVAGGERFTSDELDELSDRISHAEERADELEATHYRQLLQNVAEFSVRLHRLAHRLATWDVFAALADVAHRYDYTRPHVDDTTELTIENGRHPVVEQIAAAGQFVPNDIDLHGERERLWLITGPNMAGKSTFMRQIALIVLLAQMGSYVPATAARIGVVDRILSRVGASDNVSRGESTFMVEMRETSTILKTATPRSLVILDEIGRGTSTYDGLAVAWSVAEHLHDALRCRALFATHYHELTEFAQRARHAANHSVAAKELGDDIVFLHRVTPGPANRSYGVAVAKLAGLPEGVLARAKAILAALEENGTVPLGPKRVGAAKRNENQLDMFAAARQEASHPVLETLRAVDPDRLTPLDALQLIAKLTSML